MLRLLAAVLALIALETHVRACEPDDIPCLEKRAAAEPKNVAARLQLGTALLDVGATGSKEAARRALAEFDAVLALDPRQALARAYRGVALTMRARDEAMVYKLGLAKQGFREMDTAVAAAPTDVAVRLVRAINAYQMPLMLERGGIATADFRFLLESLESDPTKLAQELRRKILFHAGSLALKERRKDAIDLLERAARETGKTPSDEQVQSMLALARREFTPHSHADAEEQK